MDRLKEMLSEEQTQKESSPESKDNSIIVEAESLEGALNEAAQQLNVSIPDLEYEVLEKGSDGFLGVGKKPFKFLIKSLVSSGIDPELEQLKKFAVSAAEGDVQGFQEEEQKILDQDGRAKIKVTKRGIMLIVYPPVGTGRKINNDEVMQAIYDRQITPKDQNAIPGIVEQADGEPHNIAEWSPNPELDSYATIEVSEDEMKAYLTVIPPRKTGRCLDLEDVQGIMAEKGVTYGMNEKEILKILDDEVYNQPMVVANGDEPIPGEDARIEYKFRLDKTEINLEEDEKTGRVDYHSLDLVENVVVGQVLAVKIPVKEGTPGRTVTSKRIEPKIGKDVSFEPGKNTKLSDDGLQLSSEINGQVVFTKDRVNVEPIYEVKGDVNLETGNIVFLGTVIVRGNVEDGFNIKAAGNIDVRGTVGKCRLEAEGDIMIKQGLAGKDEAIVVAGNDVVAKFVEHAKLIEAGNDAVIAEGIMHSYVDAGKRVIANGKRGLIVGGRLRAGEEVNAKVIGSPAYTETEIEVGFDPKTRQQLLELEAEKREGKETVRELSINLNTLISQKKAARQLTPEKEELMKNMTKSKDELSARLNEVEEQITEMKAYLNVLEEKGKVCVQKEVYPKVRIAVKDAVLEVKDSFKYVKFIQEAKNIKVLPYEEAKVVAKKTR